MRHELTQAVAHIASVGSGGEYLDVTVRVELRKKLAARAAGHAVALALGINGDAHKFTAALADRLNAGGAFGADGIA